MFCCGPLRAYTCVPAFFLRPGMLLAFLSKPAPLQREETTMAWDQIAGQWKQLKGKAKEQWGQLTDDDLDVIAGKRDQLSGKL
jgi:uncharacterized protein YjbJ (UPF0337 family)